VFAAASPDQARADLVCAALRVVVLVVSSLAMRDVLVLVLVASAALASAAVWVRAVVQSPQATCAVTALAAPAVRRAANHVATASVTAAVVATLTAALDAQQQALQL
jgi:hypothetical protein